MSIEEARRIAEDENNIIVTEHILKRCKDRRIALDDVVNVINNGEVIEDYPEAYPHPAGLLLGFMHGDKPLHVVIAVGEGKVFLITAYYPNSDEWGNDNKTRKVVL